MSGDGFEDAGLAAQIPEGGFRIVDVEGRDVLLTRVGGAVAAFGARCTHAFASLADATVENGAIVCARHGAKFDIRNGRSLSGACPNLPVHQVRMDGPRVLVKRK